MPVQETRGDHFLPALQGLLHRRRAACAAMAALVGLSVLVLAAQQMLGGTTRGLACWWLAVVGLAFIVLGALHWRGAFATGVLTAALMIGGASQLYVTQPLWYPELFLPPRSGMETVMFGIAVAQGVLAAGVLAANVAWSGLRRFLSTFGVLPVLLFLVLSCAFTVSLLDYLRLDNLLRFRLQLAAGGGLGLINLLTIAAIAVTAPDGVRLPRGRGAVWLLTAFSFVATLLLAWFAFERVMHVQDELAYLFQARSYAGGVLELPALPEAARAAFEHYLLDTHEGRWISVFTPGWPAVLALGVLAGAPWLVNPVLGALSIPLAHDLMRRTAGERTAMIGTLLLATSPWLIAMSATLMSHSLALFLMLGAWWLLLRSEETQGVRAHALILAAGLALGWLFLTRNLDGLLIGVLTGAFLLFHTDLRRQLPRAISYSLGCIATGGLIFAYNLHFTGDALRTTLSDYYIRTWQGGSNAFGFGGGIGAPEGWGHMELLPLDHSPWEGFVNTLNNISALHTDFMGWGIGSLALVWALLIWGRKTRADWAMALVVVTIAVAHAFYWFAASYYVGPRYWFLVIAPLAYLSARGFQVLRSRLDAEGVAGGARGLNTALLVLCLFSVTVFLSYRGVTRYHDHRAYDDHYRHLALPQTEGTAAPLILFKATRQASSALFFNDPWFPADKPVFAQDLGPESNRAVIAAFPERPVLYYDEATGRFTRR
ncbi:hypothetical protein DDZ14_07765 [Maritimibacter sp. 55A14]|uniref:glycosyltransferase family 39 protein n=1 Tax=Maritimibacter sp. 55A14 TaxID=2174844 RepID=UPI000D6226DE|nr:glycosyltransferase family 39 protein [Maritimibacter sp. 55A14]PWE32978.1 hypothetical protein DDZ14_07765 [Maritimibacter sp. 55A14]